MECKEVTLIMLATIVGSTDLFHAAANAIAITALVKSMYQQWLAHYLAAYCVLPPHCADFYYPDLPQNTSPALICSLFILSLSLSLAVNSLRTKTSPWKFLYSRLGGVSLYN